MCVCDHIHIVYVCIYIYICTYTQVHLCVCESANLLGCLSGKRRKGIEIRVSGAQSPSQSELIAKVVEVSSLNFAP